MKLLLTIIFTCLNGVLFAQPGSLFVEDISSEMHYATGNGPVKDRGLSRFASDFAVSIAEAFEQEKTFTAWVYATIKISKNEVVLLRFDPRDLPPFTFEPEQVDALWTTFSSSLQSWKPAVSKGKALESKYSLSFRIKREVDSPLVVDEIKLDPTTKKSRNGLACFQLYKENVSANYGLFTNAEVNARYRGEIYSDGTAALKKDLNTLLDTTSTQANRYTRRGSFVLDFIINKKGQFGLLDAQEVRNGPDRLILGKLKLLSCNWLPSISAGRPLNASRKYRFNYVFYLNDSSGDSANYRVRITDIHILTAEDLWKKYYPELNESN